jgi:hypothetical protein
MRKRLLSRLARPYVHRHHPVWLVLCATLTLCACAVAAAAPRLPSPPGSLTLGPASRTSIQLSWGASPSHVTGYRLYVNGSARAFVRSTTYRIVGLSCGRTYALAVRAVDSHGRGSPPRSHAARTARCAAPHVASPAPTAAHCSSTTTPSASLAATIARAASGSVICLASGSYGNLTLTSIRKQADVTVQPAPGAQVAIGRLDFEMVAHLRLTGGAGRMSVGGLELDASENEPSWSHDLRFDHLTWTAASNVRARATSQALLFDHDVFDNLGIGLWEGRITVRGYEQTKPVGVTISNSHFAGGCSDGIQVIGDAYGVRIGPGDEFTNIQQGNCDPVHADPIQLYGGNGAVVTGDYFHDNGDGSGGIMSTGGDDFVTVENNVFVCSCIFPLSLDTAGADDWTIDHNTFFGGSVRFETYNDDTSSGDVVRNNVFAAGGGIAAEDKDYGVSDHNLNSHEAGTGNINGSPRFVGGKKPDSYAGFRLAPGSPGKGAASDGSDMGIRASR